MQLMAQYDPSAGVIGSKALYKDSNIFVAWTNACSINRGWQNIVDTSLGRTTVGDSNSIIGIADNNVVSLGDGGTIILNFSSPIFNGKGPDFAIFENSFDDGFLELAFVEVSSDGSTFHRFAAIDNNDTTIQYNNAAHLDATRLYNLAGKYRAGYGTPFDLEELKNIAGLDIYHITHIKLIDVIGSINDSFCSRDSRGLKINDPWPTPFPSGGFDLDAVGVIHDFNHTGFANMGSNKSIYIYPNPANDYIQIQNLESNSTIILYDITGKLIDVSQQQNIVNITDLIAGVYYLKIQQRNLCTYYSFIKQ